MKIQNKLGLILHLLFSIFIACTNADNLTSSDKSADVQDISPSDDDSASEPVMVAGSYLHGRCGSYKTEEYDYACGVHEDEIKEKDVQIEEIVVQLQSESVSITPVALPDDAPWHAAFKAEQTFSLADVVSVAIRFNVAGEVFTVESESRLAGRPLLNDLMENIEISRGLFPLDSEFNRSWRISFVSDDLTSDKNLDGFEDWIIEKGDQALESIVDKRGVLKNTRGDIQVRSGEGFGSPEQISLSASWSIESKTADMNSHVGIDLVMPKGDGNVYSLSAQLKISDLGDQYIEIIHKVPTGEPATITIVPTLNRFVTFNMHLDEENDLLSLNVDGVDSGTWLVSTTAAGDLVPGVVYSSNGPASLLSYIHFQAGYENP